MRMVWLRHGFTGRSRGGAVEGKRSEPVLLGAFVSQLCRDGSGGSGSGTMSFGTML